MPNGIAVSPDETKVYMSVKSLCLLLAQAHATTKIEVPILYVGALHSFSQSRIALRLFFVFRALSVRKCTTSENLRLCEFLCRKPESWTRNLPTYAVAKKIRVRPGLCGGWQRAVDQPSTVCLRACWRPRWTESGRARCVSLAVGLRALLEYFADQRLWILKGTCGLAVAMVFTYSVRANQDPSRCFPGG